MKHALLTILQLLVVFTPARSAGLLSDLGISSVGDGEDLVLASGGNRRSAPSALQRTRVLEHRDFQRNLTSTSLNLQTAPLGARGASGVMFYVKAKQNDISVTSIDFHSASKANGQFVQIYTRVGRYAGKELSSNGWNLIYSNMVDLGGNDEATTINLGSSAPIDKGRFRSFFIWVPNNKVRYKAGTNEGALFSSDSEIEFFEGIGKTTKFEGTVAQLHRPRVFKGSIGYKVTSSNDNSDNSSSNINAVNPISRNNCLATQRRVKICIKTDNYGYETSWVFRPRESQTVLYQSPKDAKYGPNQTYCGQYCVDVGFYVFKISDLFKDGICCSAGNGSYSIEVMKKNGQYRQAASGGSFGSNMSHVIDVGHTESKMTDRDDQYLEAHNKRRREWHSRYGKEFRPLVWSNGLKESAMIYANKLLNTCTSGPPVHDPDDDYAENIARNVGSGGWGQLYSPDKILGRFVEREEGLPWARNGHLTNAIWYASRYVGCAEANKSYMVKKANGIENEHNCRIQVCRYSKPGEYPIPILHGFYSKFAVNLKTASRLKETVTWGLTSIPTVPSIGKYQ